MFALALDLERMKHVFCSHIVAPQRGTTLLRLFSLAAIIMLGSRWCDASYSQNAIADNPSTTRPHAESKPENLPAEQVAHVYVHPDWRSERDSEAFKNGIWPQFLGPNSDNHAHSVGTLPVHWDEQTNVKWKTEIPGQAWASPIVWNDKVYLANSTTDGTERFVIELDLVTGKVLRNKRIFSNIVPQSDHHVTNSYASPTPVTDGEKLYLHFGAYGTAAISLETFDLVWQRTDLECNHYRGPGSSPVLFEDSLIFHMDGFDVQYVIALDRRTGKTLWKSERNIDYQTENGDLFKAYSTPTIFSHDESWKMISTTSKAFVLYDPMTGSELGQVTHDEFSATARPMLMENDLLVNTGFGKAKLGRVAIESFQLGRKRLDEVAFWITDQSIGSKPSQVVSENLVCSIHDRGILVMLDATTGATVTRKRLGGNFSATPLIADGKLYLFDEAGNGYVLDAANELGEIGGGVLNEGCMASPIAVGNSLIVRTKTSVYCLEQP